YGAVTVSAVRDQVNSVLDPSAGSLITASLLHASRLVGSDTLYEFNRGQFEVSSYSRLGRRGVFAWRALAGTIVPARRIALAGQVWERGGDPSTVAGVRVTPGVGVRFTTPLGPVRLDAAYNGYPAEPGPLYFQDNKTNNLTLTGETYQPGLPAGFWRRVVVQFAVGQAF